MKLVTQNTKRANFYVKINFPVSKKNNNIQKCVHTLRILFATKYEILHLTEVIYTQQGKFSHQTEKMLHSTSKIYTQLGKFYTQLSKFTPNWKNLHPISSCLFRRNYFHIDIAS